MKWYSYLICFVLVIVGVFCGIELYKEVKAESYINGSIDISNKYSQESFNFASTSVVFYHDLYDGTDTFVFEQDLLKVEDFNGQEKHYELWLNEFIILDAEFNTGSVYSDVFIDFYNEFGEVINSSILKISIKFLSGKTGLTLSTTSQENASFLEQFFSDNGIRLKVIEIL